MYDNNNCSVPITFLGSTIIVEILCSVLRSRLRFAIETYIRLCWKMIYGNELNGLMSVSEGSIFIEISSCACFQQLWARMNER